MLASGAVELKADTRCLPLRPYVEVLEDPTGALTLGVLEDGHREVAGRVLKERVDRTPRQERTPLKGFQPRTQSTPGRDGPISPSSSGATSWASTTTTPT